MRSDRLNKRFLRALIGAAVLVLFVLATCACAQKSYRTLQSGDSGEDVYALKERMYYLGYFNTLKMGDKYTETTAERVAQLQALNGLEETGIATPELQELIFSDACIWKGTTPVPTKTPAPTATPVPTPTPPPLTEEGFLDTEAAGEEEYVLIDTNLGIWRYISSTLSIEITRHKENKNRWFECEIWASEETPLSTVLSSGRNTGVTRIQPQTLVNNNKCVLAISDDYYAYRIENKETVGIEIRNGEIKNDKTVRENFPHFPNLETLAVFTDGSMKTYHSNALTAQEYLDLGATNVFSFGPILITNGELGEHMSDKSYYYYKEPRMAIGMIEPYHYLIVTVDGRLESENIVGVHLDWLASLMLERGCTEALNLDGGGTACLMFMGTRLNKTGSSIRSLGSMIYFGTSDLVGK